MVHTLLIEDTVFCRKKLIFHVAADSSVCWYVVWDIYTPRILNSPYFYNNLINILIAYFFSWSALSIFIANKPG